VVLLLPQNPQRSPINKRHANDARQKSSVSDVAEPAVNGWLSEGKVSLPGFIAQPST
jgi:hypothetical protein